MALKNYILNGPSVVIAVDARSWLVSWENHLKRTGGLRGGIDLVALTPVPVRAPTDGIMERRPNDGGAGNSCRFWHDDNPGWADVFSHLSAYAGKDGQHFEQGDIIGWTGTSGGVAPHLHRHLLDPYNKRRNPWLYFIKPPVTITAAAEAPKPLIVNTPPERKKTSMSTGYYVVHNKDKTNETTEYALAGDGNGTAAWLPLGYNAAQKVAAIHGNFVELSESSWNDFKGRYLSAPAPVTLSGTTLTIDYAALGAAVATALNNDTARRLLS